MVLVNARIGPAPELSTILVEGHDIRAVLPGARRATPGEIDLQGRTVLPGLDDAHLHAYSFGRTLTAIDLRPARSLSDLCTRLSSERPERTGWYRGHGWEGTSIVGSGAQGRLTAIDIDAATPHGPALLGDSTGHLALCNTQALRAAGIGPSTPDPIGGIIDRDQAGQPTGLLMESAVALVSRAIPSISPAERRSAILAAQSELLRRGIIAITDPGLGPGGTTLLDGTGTFDAICAYRDLEAGGDLLMRTHVMLLFGGLGGTSAREVAEGLDEWGPPRRAHRTGRLSVDQLKVFADGIPRSRTAWLREPYDDCTHGHLTVSGDTDQARVTELNAIIAAAATRGWQVGAHCTGDAAIGAFIDAVEATNTGPALRHYLIHADLIAPMDLMRLPRLGMVLNTNPSIRWTVGRRVEPIIGQDRNLRRQPLRRALDAGVFVVASSDAPVVAPDWQTIMAAAMTRSMKDDPAYSDDQAVSAHEAIDMMTSTAAWQSHEESWRGRIAPGMAADLVVLDTDAHWNEPWSLADASVAATIIDGEVVYGELT